MSALKAGADFYGGDWCGIIEGDLEMEAWAPTLWYDVDTKGMTETRFHELEETNAMERWIEALYECKPVIVPDTSIYKEINPVEYEIYSRCKADSLLAVPFWKNPVGFMIVRSPKRYIRAPFESGFLQALAYVAFSSVTEQKLIRRTQKVISPDVIQKDNDVYISIFDSIQIYTSKGMVTEAEISSPRIGRFLVYMLLHKINSIPGTNTSLPPRTILENVWPGEDLENAGTKIKSLAYRLQMVFDLISDYRLVISTPEGYKLNSELNIITDVEMFTSYCKRYPHILMLETKLEILDKAINLYGGGLYPAANCEDWILNDQDSYRLDCLEVYAEIMRTYFENQDYVRVRHYAEMALQLDKASVDAYYWKIRVIRRRNSQSLANGQLRIAERTLTSEEYSDLLRKLKKTEELDV